MCRIRKTLMSALPSAVLVYWNALFAEVGTPLRHPATEPQAIQTHSCPTESEDPLAYWREWFEAHRANAQPLPAFDRRPLVPLELPTGHALFHSTLTGETAELPLGVFFHTPSGFAPGSFPADGSELLPLDNYSDLYQITNPADYPWRVACKLFISNQGTFIGSGMLIDPKHVITAGHCVYDQPNARWVEQIQVIPAYENGVQPYGDGISTGFLAWTPFVEDGNGDFDMGIIVLDRPVGALTGWHGYGYNNDDNWFIGPVFNNPSYPGCMQSGLYMYNWFGTVDVVYTNLLQVNRLGCGGMSGCGAYATISGNRIVYSNGAYQNSEQGWHRQCRITQTKFTDITNYIISHRPANADLVALDCNVSPSTIQAGLQLTSLDVLVHNYSTGSFSQGTSADVYLSANNIISTGDVYLGTEQLSYSWSSLQSIRHFWDEAPEIGNSTPAGDYYIGVILNHSDSNNGNNASSYEDAAPITITACPAIPGPVLSTPSDGAVLCQSFVYNYRWRQAPTATSYNIQWANNPSFIFPQTSTTSDTFITHSLSNGTYYWRVRGLSACRVGDWSNVRSLNVVGAPSTPTGLTPNFNARVCADSPLNFCWNSAPNATQYVVYWADNPMFNGAIWQTTSDTCISHTVTGNDTVYWRVFAQNPCFGGIYSSTAQVIAEPLAPSTVVIWKHGILQLIWTPNACATYYRVEWTPSLAQPFTTLATTTGLTLTLSEVPLLGVYQVITVQ